jgi:hypothetical protein
MNTPIAPAEATPRTIGLGTARVSLLVRASLGLSAGLACTFSAGAQDAAPEAIPAEQTAAAVKERNWRPPRFSWGHANLEGTFTSRDMQGIPLQRPEQFGTRQFLTSEEFRERLNAGPGGFAAFVTQQSEDESRIELSALDSTETGTRVFGYTSYVIAPENGRLPAFTDEGQQRRQRGGGQANGPFYTTEDFSYYDRCISRGVTGSIMPSLYGDAMRIIQSPTEVAISYEMLHDTRVIPLDGRPALGKDIHLYMGDSRGRYEGDTLVVESRNFTDKTAVGGAVHSEGLRMVERFRRIDPEMIDYEIRVEDPLTWEQPWTLRMTITKQPDYEIYEYACHEGNMALRHILSGERAYERAAAEAAAKGQPLPERVFDRVNGPDRAR